MLTTSKLLVAEKRISVPLTVAVPDKFCPSKQLSCIWLPQPSSTLLSRWKSLTETAVMPFSTIVPVRLTLSSVAPATLFR